MTGGLFITGTDTGVGKTVVACAMLRSWVAQGWRAVGMKPVAAGIAAGAKCNEDVARTASHHALCVAITERIIRWSAAGDFVPEKVPQ